MGTAEGWDPGFYDPRCLHATAPNGLFVGLIGDELITSILAVKHDHTFGFIRLYIVKSEYRSLGYGLKLWNAALESMVNRLIEMDGVFSEQEESHKSGFALLYSNLN